MGFRRVCVGLTVALFVATAACTARAGAGAVSINTSGSTSFDVFGAMVDFGAGRIRAERVTVKAEAGVCKVSMVIYADANGDGRRAPDGSEDRINASADASGVNGGTGVQGLTMHGGTASWNVGQGEPRMEITVEFCNGMSNGVSMPLGGAN